MSDPCVTCKNCLIDEDLPVKYSRCGVKFYIRDETPDFITGTTKPLKRMQLLDARKFEHCDLYAPLPEKTSFLKTMKNSLSNLITRWIFPYLKEEH